MQIAASHSCYVHEGPHCAWKIELKPRLSPRIFRLLLWLGLICCVGAVQAREVRVGVYSNEPKIFIDAAGKPEPAYREARTTVVLGAGEERRVNLRCPFEPATVLVDPDARVLQLRRKAAAVKL